MERFDIHTAPLEIERKFLIEYPDIERLSRMPDYHVEHLEQSYLDAHGELRGGRIRRVETELSTTYYYTYKEHITDVTRREYERKISEQEYRALLSHRAPGTHTIQKDRHVFCYSGLTYELDVYDFWDDRATLECEVDSEETEIPIPPCVTLIREVTHDRRYHNSRLAVSHSIEITEP